MSGVLMRDEDAPTLRRLFCWLVALFTLTMAGRIVSGDGEAMYQTTVAVVTRGSLAIDPLPETAVGRQGRSYGKYGLGQSIAQSPFVIVGHLIGAITDDATTSDRASRFLVGLTNGVMTALALSVLWLILRDAGSTSSAATAVVVLTATTTIFAAYARADFAEPTQALGVLFAYWAALRASEASRHGDAHRVLQWSACAGFGVAVAFLTKAASLILAPAVTLPIALSAFRIARLSAPVHLRLAMSVLAVCAAPVLVAGSVQAGLNFYRFGDVLAFGYGDEPTTGFTTSLRDGVGYLLWSSGKGLVWFAPTAAVGGLLLVWLAWMRPLMAVTCILLFLTELGYYARWWAWHGDWSWGPRYLHVTVPFLMLGWLAPVLSWNIRLRNRLARMTLGTLSATVGLAGLWVNVLSVAIDYGSYYSVVGNQIGRGIDVRHARMVPDFSPLWGHTWLLASSAYEVVMPPHPVESNPFRLRYPWADSYPELVPEAPERAWGFDVWWAAHRGPHRFLDYWATLIALWLLVTVMALPFRGRT